MAGGSTKSGPDQVLPYLYIGNKANAKNIGVLQSLGIKRILNRATDPVAGCPNFHEKTGLFVYKRIPIFDNRGEDILSHMDEAIAFIEQGKHYGSVLVHCNKGVSRSSSIVMGYLMNKRDMSFKEAFDCLRMTRPVVNPHEGFISQLKKYDVQLAAERKGSDGESSKTASIGPSLMDGQGQATPSDRDDDEGGAAAQVGPCIGPSPIVEPCLGQDDKDGAGVSRLETAPQPEELQNEQTPKGPAIGPARAGHSAKRKAVEEAEGGARRKGPTLGPAAPPPGGNGPQL